MIPTSLHTKETTQEIKKAIGDSSDPLEDINKNFESRGLELRPFFIKRFIKDVN